MAGRGGRNAMEVFGLGLRAAPSLKTEYLTPLLIKKKPEKSPEKARKKPWKKPEKSPDFAS